jgi:plastocyanin
MLTLGAVPLVLVLVAGASATAAIAAETHEVAMKAVDFEPRQIRVRVGDTVEWTNGDIVAHTATAQDRSWDVNVLPKRSGRMTMKTAGTVSYFCRYHLNMKGEIIVAP